jgi:hypothetical protein
MSNKNYGLALGAAKELSKELRPELQQQHISLIDGLVGSFEGTRMVWPETIREAAGFAADSLFRKAGS